MLLLTSDRTFQLWEYFVSHGSLLIRSPKQDGLQTNIDIICRGVEYLSSPRFLRGIEVYDMTIKGPHELGINIEFYRPDCRICRLITNGNEYNIVSASISISENSEDIFSSPFEWRR